MLNASDCPSINTRTSYFGVWRNTNVSSLLDKRDAVNLPVSQGALVLSRLWSESVRLFDKS